MNAFEEFFRKPPEERRVEPERAPRSPRAIKRSPDAPVDFVDAIRGIAAFMRSASEAEWTEWLVHTEQKRIGRLERNRKLGSHRNPETQKAKARRKRLSKILRDKEIFARVREVGFQNLNTEERADLAVAQHRSAAKSRRNARKQQPTLPRED